MRIKDGYSLVKLADKDYLLPYGQNINDQRRGICLNDTSLFLIQTLQTDITYEELFSAFAAYCKAEPVDYPRLKDDLQQFITQLSDLGILAEEPLPETCTHFFEIGTLCIGLSAPTELIHKHFADFVHKESNPIPDLSFYVTDRYPRQRRVGNILVRTQELMICEDDEGFFFLYPSSLSLMECHLSKDYSKAWFYCRNLEQKELKEELFHAFRLIYLILAQKHGLFALHSASILYQDKAWLFSGSSGTGKSTHTSLWKEAYHTPLLNGDLNLIGIKDGKAYVYGLPWCGTSECYTPLTYPLGGITLLKKHPIEEHELLSDDHKQLLVMQRFISPTWNKEMLQKNLDFSAKLCGLIPIFSLKCTKEASAAHYMKDLIDDTLKD